MNTAAITNHISLKEIDGGKIAEIHVSGTLTRADYDLTLPRLEAMIARWPKIGLLVILDDFHGWEPSAAWADMKFDFKHGREFGRIAIVGESALQRWGTKFSDLIFPGEIRYFEPAEAGAARAWVRGLATP